MSDSPSLQKAAGKGELCSREEIKALAAGLLGLWVVSCCSGRMCA